MNATRNLLPLVFVIAAILPLDRLKADFVFGTPVNLGPVINTAINEANLWISPDDLSLFFAQTSNWQGAYDIRMTTRASKDAPWGTSVSLGIWGGAGDVTAIYRYVKAAPGITTPDGLELYFSEMRPGGYGSSDLWMMKRETIEAAWGAPVNLGPLVNSLYDEMAPTISPDGLELYFSGYNCAGARPDGTGCADLWVNLGPTVNSTANDARPILLAEGLLLLFDSARAGGYGQADLYMMRRASLSDPWGPPTNLGPVVNSSAFEECGYLSAEGSTLYWDCGRPGGYGGHDLWQVSITPIVDFNGDGVVDEKEAAILTAHLGKNEPLCDIGPTPLGDGVVNAKDLKALSEYMDKKVPDATLRAHWALDETEGMLAADRVAGNHAIALGNPAWQPAGGKVGGALQFDGKDDFLRPVSSVLDPAQGPFSVLAWVQGGAPGQVILSQTGGANWLLAQLGTGFLMSDLKLHRLLNPVVSPAVITDGAWHRVGFVWDGANRLLYVDGVEVARAPQSALAGSTGGLHIGADSKLTPGNFWSGLIDDFRIYNRVVKP
jgi:hypothetical protein